MQIRQHLRLEDIEPRVCDIASRELDIPREKVTPASRLIEDLHCDSIDLIELVKEFEEAFDVTLPEEAPNGVCKSFFARRDVRLSDLAEYIYLQQGTGRPQRRWGRQSATPNGSGTNVPFTQLGGRWNGKHAPSRPLFEKLFMDDGTTQFRRQSDGMRCVLIPGGEVEIGSTSPHALPDEGPVHRVVIDPFLIDAETVSTTAYCRFLNSIGAVDDQLLLEWFILPPDDDRIAHQLIDKNGAVWQPKPGTERWPMILVSWFGANAYSLWANGRDWRAYDSEDVETAECFLPTEAQWEYAARGPTTVEYPWGNRPPTQDDMRFGLFDPSFPYMVEDLPFADVHEPLAQSPLGPVQMAGNVWQWCRDWYMDDFYRTSESRTRNPLQSRVTGVRSERGGSWVGPAFLCRSSYRRGRNPAARGRCLGFRCISVLQDLIEKGMLMRS